VNEEYGAMERLKEMASRGYVRNNLVVLQGGANKATGTDNATPITASEPVAQNETVMVSAEAEPTHSHDHGKGNGHGESGGLRTAPSNGATKSVAVSETVMDAVDTKLAQIREARIKGYEGEACEECGNFTLVRNGTCMKCNTCGGTSGCS
jgi:ribonucleoside-diphosphate reductase alpha chain